VESAPEDPAGWLAYAEEHGDWTTPRPGTRMALFAVRKTRPCAGYDDPLHRVMRVIARRIDQHGPLLLVPKVDVAGGWTTLASDAEPIIALDADHATSEQLHSEFKTDVGIERLPSGKFATNALLLVCAMLAYNNPAVARPRRAVGTGCPAAPSGPAAPPAHGDAGVDVCGGAPHSHRSPPEIGLCRRRPGAVRLPPPRPPTGHYLSVPAADRRSPRNAMLAGLIRYCLKCT
jgi:hypothetical protein